MRKLFKRASPIVVAAVAVSGAVVASTPASAFGALSILGWHGEHNRITRVLSCESDPRPEACFQKATLDVLAGRTGAFPSTVANLGAVGMPDYIWQGLGPASKHCDDADYSPAQGYPQSREAADKALRECVTAYSDRLNQAVAAAGRLVDASGTVNQAQADISRGCALGIEPDNSQPGKCEVLNGIGRALHTAQDFFSHSNWSDAVSVPPGQGPQGLDRTDLPQFFNYPTPASYAIPTALVTGCDDSVPVIGPIECRGRITHSMMNKDTGIIDPKTGKATDPSTPRGQIAENFQDAVSMARKQTAATWGFFRDRLESVYGSARADLMIRVISQDKV